MMNRDPAGNPSIIAAAAALSYGANQFKVNFQRLREVFSESGWGSRTS